MDLLDPDKEEKIKKYVFSILKEKRGFAEISKKLQCCRSTISGYSSGRRKCKSDILDRIICVMIELGYVCKKEIDDISKGGNGDEYIYEISESIIRE